MLLFGSACWYCHALCNLSLSYETLVARVVFWATLGDV
jgi:hypothetical protein